MLVEMYEITIFEQNKHGKQNGTPGFSLPLFFFRSVFRFAISDC